MKYTINEFASQIRNLYPNDYDDLTDEKLVELWLKKYPDDIEKIDFKIQINEKKSKNIIEYSIEFIFAIAVLGFLFIGVMYLKDPENVKNRLGLSNNNSIYIEDESSSSKETNIEDNSSSSEETNIENNSSINEQNSSEQSSSQQQEQRRCSSCNGSGKCSTCMKSFRVHYWAGKGPGWKDENETRPGKVMCNDCHGAGVIYGSKLLGEDPESKKCYVGSCNNGWLNCRECNYSGNGNKLGECKKCKGSGVDN
jgi:hypothetical protein